MNSSNDKNREMSAASSEKVTELIAKSVAYLAHTSEQLKGVRSEMRKVESELAASKAAELAALGMAPPPVVNAGGNNAGNNGNNGGGGNGGGGTAYSGGGGGGGVAISAETQTMIESLVDKVKLIEKHHGDQLRALVAKTKELHRVVKHQQEQISALTGMYPLL